MFIVIFFLELSFCSNYDFHLCAICPCLPSTLFPFLFFYFYFILFYFNFVVVVVALLNLLYWLQRKFTYPLPLPAPPFSLLPHPPGPVVVILSRILIHVYDIGSVRRSSLIPGHWSQFLYFGYACDFFLTCKFYCGYNEYHISLFSVYGQIILEISSDIGWNNIIIISRMICSDTIYMYWK